MNAKLKTDALDLTSLLNGLVFFSPVSLLVRTTAGISLSQFFILQAIMATMVLLTEIPLGKLTDRIGYKSTLVLYQIALLISRTCLLLAHVSCNYSLFILQAILEGTAASFSSGTQSGYIYIMFQRNITLKICTCRQLWNCRIFCQYPSLCGPVHADWHQGSASGNDCRKPCCCLYLFKNPQGNSAAQK